MKMKLGELANKMPSLIKLGGIDLPAIDAFKIKMLIDKFEPHKNNYDEQLGKLFMKYGEVINDRYIVKQNKTEDFLKERNELEELNVEVESSTVTITLTNDISLSAKDISALEGIIKFKINEEVAK